MRSFLRFKVGRFVVYQPLKSNKPISKAGYYWVLFMWAFIALTVISCFIFGITA